MTVLMIEILPIAEVNDFINELNDLIDKYGDRLHGISPYDLVAEMGFSTPE